MIEIATVPRDINELNKLKVGQIIRLASQLHLLDSDDNDQAFKTLPPEGKVAAVYNALLEHDARGGQVQPMTAPPQGAIPQQPQYQPPPQAQMTQPQPQYQPPMAPPPQQQLPQQQAYPGYPPPVPPAVQQQQAAPQYAPQPQYQPPQAPPPQAYPPPPMQQQPQYQQAPQVQQAYPPPPPQAPPPQQPPVAQRQPQTGSDPNNQGSTVVNALTDVVNQVLAGQSLLGRSLANVGAMVTASSEVNRCLVQILVAMSEQMGMDADDLAKVIKHQDPSTVDKLLTKMGVGMGGGK